MAWLESSPSGIYQIAFRFAGENTRSRRERATREAESRLHRVEDYIRLAESGRFDIPTGVDVATFMLSDGKLTGRKPVQGTTRPPRTLTALAQAYLASIPKGALETSTIHCMEIHFRHLLRHLTASCVVGALRLEDLQRYVDLRSREPGRYGKQLSTTTIRKEIATLRQLCNWACEAGHLTQPLPLKGLRYPKLKEKQPFQTLEEIERRITANEFTTAEAHELWASLFFTIDETEALLDYIQQNQRHQFDYPMFVFAAYTGARRSEMIRSERDDIDLNSRQVTIREKKRVRGQMTRRVVPISDRLAEALVQWMAVHPGGRVTFTLGAHVARSSKTGRIAEPLTRDEAHDHFRRALAGTKWANAKGWHVFRHSFCSNERVHCALKCTKPRRSSA